MQGRCTAQHRRPLLPRKPVKDTALAAHCRASTCKTPRHTTAPKNHCTRLHPPPRNHHINIPRASLPVRSHSLSSLFQLLVSCEAVSGLLPSSRVFSFLYFITPSRLAPHSSSPPKKSSRLAKRQLLTSPDREKLASENQKLPSPSNPSRTDRARPAGRHGHLLAQLSMAQLLPRAPLLVPLCCSLNPSQSLRRSSALSVSSVSV
jgi:hypothetical protein